jgi:ATP-binding cassette subfamily G (WHITE) protein 2
VGRFFPPDPAVDCQLHAARIPARKCALLAEIAAWQHIPTSGTVLLNGEPISSASKRFIGLVPQEDVILPTVTVEEAISFSAELRVGRRVSHEERRVRVSQIISDLSLSSVRDSRVGDTRRRKGISGGERKRCSIGVEMVHRPRLLLLDEPTSGLDSSSAHALLLLLRKLARERNVAVAFTVHQPSSRDFALFDRLLVSPPLDQRSRSRPSAPRVGSARHRPPCPA